jgi:diguanylate cyclase
MDGGLTGRRSAVRPFAAYAVISLIPVLALGFVLARTFGGQARTRGLAQGRAEAVLMAQTAIAPLFGDRAPTGQLTSAQHRRLAELTQRAIADGAVLRLRIRDRAGRVLFSDDHSGLTAKPDDEALDAGHGRVIAALTRVNADTNDTGRPGVASVEVYVPITSSIHRQLAVLEVYLPYAPISHDTAAGVGRLSLALVLGLAVLYLTLFAITASATRGLRRAAARNGFLAEHDALTELPNRALFRRRASSAIRLGMWRRRSVTIAIVDLDRFQEVNDTLGHHSGDRLLVELAGRLAQTMPRGDTVARLGGDEFGLVVTNPDPEDLLRRLRTVIDGEVELSGLPVTVQASIGYARAPEDGTDVDALLQRADMAMYAAKSRHAGVLRYDPGSDHYNASKLALVAELRHAIDEDQLVLHYQPQRVLADGRVAAVEALVRWQHPVHGLLYPDAFLPQAEQTDLIDRLTEWVLWTALREATELGTAGDAPAVAVNVSARTISRASFADEVIQILKALDVPPSRLIIEVTETALLADPERAAGVLARLADVGVSLSLDDFGRGQTSLRYLSSLPIHELKIDRSFVTDVDCNDAHAAIVRSMIELGHNLDLRVVAEGVETDAVLGILRTFGCDLVQGFLLARPMPSDQIAGWINPPASQRSAPRAA